METCGDSLISLRRTAEVGDSLLSRKLENFFLFIFSIPSANRSIFDPILRNAGHRGYPHILSGIGDRPEITEGSYRRVESGDLLHDLYVRNIKIDIQAIASVVFQQVSPYMGGIGVSSAVVSFNVALYYNTIIAWCLFYFVQVSFFF